MSIHAIQYLQREQVDVVKWNRCIDGATNGLIYAYSFYLDHMGKHWDALVMGDYEAVMPLTWNKKYGIRYLYQPAFTASLGVFGNSLTEEKINLFIASIPSKFRLIEISLNSGNVFHSLPGVVAMRNNYILNLNRTYEELFRGFRENVRRNIKKSQQLGARYESDVPVAEIIKLSRRHLQSVTTTTDSDYLRFEQLYSYLKKNDRAKACGVYLSEQLVASAVYFFSHNRAYYILVGNHPNGKTVGASHYLIDRFIHSYAGQDVVLDFEGSDVRNLAFFYSSFGATLEPYPAIRINTLPWWVKIFKR